MTNEDVKTLEKSLSFPDFASKIIEFSATLDHLLENMETGKDWKCHDYFEAFYDNLEKAVKKMEIFPHHILWDYVEERDPLNLTESPRCVLRNLTSMRPGKLPVKPEFLDELCRRGYYEAPSKHEDLTQKIRAFLLGKEIPELLNFSMCDGYEYINIPVVSKNRKVDHALNAFWVLTLIFEEKDGEFITRKDFIKQAIFLSKQVGKAWDSLFEKIAGQLEEKIDIKEPTGKKGEIVEISRLLAEEFQVSLCSFFLSDDDDSFLHFLSGSKPGIGDENLEYSLTEHSNPIVSSYLQNQFINISGGEKLEAIPALVDIESRFDFSIENVLLMPVSVGKRKVGVLALFRPSCPQTSNPDSNIIGRSFSAAEIVLLERIMRHLFDILVWYRSIHRQVEGMQSLVKLVLPPLKSITDSSQYLLKKKVSPHKYSQTLQSLNGLSKISQNYAENFMKVLEIDTGSLELKKERIPDIRKYLIGHARAYLPMIQRKCIHIWVNGDFPPSAGLHVGRGAFDFAVSNLLDNGAKYSFHPEERDQLGRQAKPGSFEDEENIHVNIRADGNSAVFTFSSIGIEIKEEEREKVFERGFRGAEAKERVDGTGYGLYIAREIVRLHGGDIELVYNHNSHKSIFKVTLPLGEKER